MTETTAELTVQKEKWKNRVTAVLQVFTAIAIITVFLMMYFVVVSLLKINNLTETNNDLSKLTVTISKRLEDCTTPTGDCYKNAQTSQGSAVVTLNTVTKAAVICADRPGSISESELEKCIQEEIPKLTPVKE